MHTWVIAASGGLLGACVVAAAAIIHAAQHRDDVVPTPVPVLAGATTVGIALWLPFALLVGPAATTVVAAVTGLSAATTAACTTRHHQAPRRSVVTEIATPVEPGHDTAETHAAVA